MFEKAVIMQRKISFSSLSGLKGLKRQLTTQRKTAAPHVTFHGIQQVFSQTAVKLFFGK